jgi:multiple sugar transport system permease protein
MEKKNAFLISWHKLVGNKYNTILFVIPSMLGIAVFILTPLIDVGRRSLINGISGGFTGISNYKLVVENQAFQLAAKNTIRFDIICLPILLILSLLIAVSVKNMSNWVKFAFLIPLSVPDNSVAVIWNLLFEKAGVLNGVLVNYLHMKPLDFLYSDNVFYMLIATYIWKYIGYDMLIWLAGLTMIPTDIYEAARVDGAGNIRIFFSITLPNIRGAAYTVTVLSFVNSFKVFREAYLISGSYPNSSIYMMQHLFNNWFAKLDINKLAAGAVITAVFLFAVLGFIRLVLMPGSDEKNRIAKSRFKKNKGGGGTT